MNEAQQPAGVQATKKTSRKEWFKRGISTLIAVVTVLGAFVAWRAQVAGTESGDLEAEGLRASQAGKEVENRIIIEVAEHLTAYLDFLRNRTLAFSALQDMNNTENITPEEEVKIYREFVENIDLAASTKRYFFPGRYLEYNESGDTYNYALEYNELYAFEERDRDLDPQKSFDRADQLGDKVMALLGVLVVLAISLWLLAISEILGTATRYATGIGGIFFLLLGAYGVYNIENSAGQPSVIVDQLWLFSFSFAGLTLLGSAVLLTFSIIRQRPKMATATVQAPPYNPAMPPPGGQPYIPPAPPSVNDAPVPVFVPNPGNQPLPTHANSQPVMVPPVQTTPQDAKEEEEQEELFKRLILILIASVALIASVIAFLQSDAGNQEGAANRNVQVDSVNRLGRNIFGAAATSFDYGAAVRIWKQLDTQSKTADAFGDPAQAARYANARDSITQISSVVFGTTYYDPEVDDVPDRFAYDADIYKAEVAGLNERATIQTRLKNDWGAKASAYIAHLTLLAVSLALLGLSLAVSGFVRYILAGAGVLMVLITLVWSIGVYNQQVKTLNLDAIDAYAKGQGLWLSGKTNEAIDAYNEALAIESRYATAMYARGNAHSDLAYLAYGVKDYDLADEEYQKAVDDYLAAIRAGKDDVPTNWSLAWIYYLQGRIDDAITINKHIEDLDPTVIGPRLNHALALLVQGKYEESELVYNTAIAKVADQVIEAKSGGTQLDESFWHYLDAGVTDLDSVIDRIDGLDYYYTGAPVLDKIANPEETRTTALDFILKLKSSTAGFEFNGKPPEGVPTASIGNFTFKAIDPESESKDPVEWEDNYMPYNTKTVKVGFHYAGIEEGQRVLFKLYKENVEQRDYRQSVTWPQLDAEGDYEFDVADPAAQFRQTDFNPGAENRLMSLANYSAQFTFPPGDYIAELYIDDHLVRRGSFEVQYEPVSTPAPDATPTP